jgi:hypothetical protein
MRHAPRPHARRLRARVAPVVIAAAALAAAAPAGAHDGPSARSEADVVSPGHAYVLRGEGWFAGPRCGARVWISQHEAHGVRVGSARIRDNGAFSFSRALPRDARRGARIVLGVTQYCDGVGTSRTVRLRIGKDHHGCGGPLSDAETAYDITVIGGLGCAAGEVAIGEFIDTRIEPAGWTCAHVDRRVADHDFACSEIDRPGRRVVARDVREV